MESEEKLLMRRSHLNRQLYNSKAINNAETPENQPTQYLGYDSATGRGKLKNFSGSRIYGQTITNGAIARGDMVRMRGDRYDTMPTVQEQSATPKQRKQLQGFIVWNIGLTKTGHADRAVDFFSGILDRDDPQWKKSVSYDDTEMPDISKLKLIYIPMPNRSLSTQEVRKLKSFQKSGGWTFTTGEHASFSTERRKANEIMAILNSPLRCVDNTSTYAGAAGGANYPATFKSITSLYGNAACEIDGGSSISKIPSSVFTPGVNITWIAYHGGSKTILSGDVDWASASTPFDPNNPLNQNPKFAKLLLKL
ncbi:hypothetical protein [Anabaena sp. CCY 9910]|uniref:hypothetical protein n=1 Tax=Anabaena sp. CCY 9910 TaxID=3103870 RepID=UPI0039E16B51